MLVLEHIKISNSIINDLTISLRDNELVNIVCEDDETRKALFDVLSGLKGYDQGDLLVNGFSTQSFKKHQWNLYRKCFVGIAYMTDLNQTVEQTIELSLAFSNLPHLLKKTTVKNVLEYLHLTKEKCDYVDSLTEEKQILVALAKAIATRKPVILYGYEVVTPRIMAVLNELSEECLVVMFSKYDESLAVDRTIKISSGKNIEDTHPVKIGDKKKGSFEMKAPSFYVKTMTHIILSNIKRYPIDACIAFIMLALPFFIDYILFVCVGVCSHMITSKQKNELLFFKQLGASFYDLNKLVTTEMIVLLFLPMVMAFVLKQNIGLKVLGTVILTILFNALMIKLKIEREN